MITNIVVTDLNMVPITGAVVVVNGQQQGITDNVGNATVNAADTDQVVISASGYTDKTVAGGLLQSTASIEMTPVNSVSSILPWLLAGGAAIYLLSGKKKSVGSKKSNTAIIIGVGVVGIAVVYMMSKKTATASTAIPPIAGTTAPSMNSFSGLANIFGSGSSITKAISSLFGSTTAPPGTAAAFIPASTDFSGQETPDVAAGYTDISPVAPTLDFSAAPGMSGVRKRMGRI
jgi:hypothetical protein